MPAILKAISDLNISPFEQKMLKLKTQVNKFAEQDLAKVGRSIGTVFSVYAIARFTMQISSLAKELEAISSRTGVPTEGLQALRNLFVENDIAADNLSGVLTKLRSSMDRAAITPQVAAAWNALKINFSEITKMNVDQAFVEIAKAQARLAGDSQAQAAVGILLGQSYDSLKAVLNTLATEGYSKVIEKQKELNQLMGTDSARALAVMRKEAEGAGRSLRSVGGNILAYMGGGLKAFATMITHKGDWSKAAESVFGPQEEPLSPLKAFLENRRKAKSAEAIENLLTSKRDKAVAGARKWYDDQVSRISVSGTNADSLAKIGGFTGGRANPMMAIAERQLKIAELQKELQERITKATEESNTALGDIRGLMEE